MNPAVDAYIAQSEMWPDEMIALRPFLLGAGWRASRSWRPEFSPARAYVILDLGTTLDQEPER